MQRKKKLTVAALGVATLAFPVVAAGTALGHGYTDSPSSRQARCAAGEVKNCGAIQWEPQSVEGPKGFPQSGPKDGSICSAGLSQFAQLDDPRGGEWPAQKLTAGEQFSFRWKLTVNHSTTSFRYFITKDGYDPGKPLTRADLEPAPFLEKQYNGAQPPMTVTHQGAVPSGKTGKHLILGIWDIADTGNAFYACSDVDFGGGKSAGASGSGSGSGIVPMSAGQRSAAAADVAEKSEADGTAGTHENHGAGAPASSDEKASEAQEGNHAGHGAEPEASASSDAKDAKGAKDSKDAELAAVAGDSHDMGGGSGGMDGSMLILAGAVGALVGGGIMGLRRRLPARHTR